MKMTDLQGQPRSFQSRAQWRAWLAENHHVEREAWLVIHKKHASTVGLTYVEALEEALCFGWIDGILKRIDDEKHLIRFSPRRKNCIWSEQNKKRVRQLIREGRMTEASLARVQEAKANGQWDKAAQRENTTLVPAELTAALAKNEQARRHFDGLAPSYRRQFIHWVSSAKRQETHAKRIQTALALLAQNKRLGLP
jgi:uncharacterized protein YdeI (YjbR/CyaY-like superfamily)